MATVERGSTKTIRIVVTGETQPIGVENFYRVARGALGVPLLEVEDADITMVEAPSGTYTYTIELTAAQTKALPAGVLFHELYEVSDSVRNSLMRAEDLPVADSQLTRHP